MKIGDFIKWPLNISSFAQYFGSKTKTMTAKCMWPFNKVTFNETWLSVVAAIAFNSNSDITSFTTYVSWKSGTVN